MPHLGDESHRRGLDRILMWECQTRFKYASFTVPQCGKVTVDVNGKNILEGVRRSWCSQQRWGRGWRMQESYNRLPDNQNLPFVKIVLINKTCFRSPDASRFLDQGQDGTDQQKSLQQDASWALQAAFAEEVYWKALKSWRTLYSDVFRSAPRK